MEDSIFNQLADVLKSRGGAFPSIKGPVFKELLETIFSEEESALAGFLPTTPVTVDDMAEKTGQSSDTVGELLESMARKGILYSTLHNGKRIYRLLPLIPGIFENQAMGGGMDERTRKIAKLTVDYLFVLMELEKTRDERLTNVPFGRIVSIDQEIAGSVAVQPYDRLISYLEKTDHFARATCHCRHVGELIGYPCSKPKDVCLFLGPSAQYLTEYGFAKPISREEAIDTLRRAEEAGLVHMVSNTGDRIDFICNCCSCHCDTLKSFRRAPDYARAARSSFVVEVKGAACVGCGECLPRCPVEAISLQDDTAMVDEEVCIGCGVCLSVCAPQAMALKNREAAPVPFDNAKKLNQAILASIKS